MTTVHVALTEKSYNIQIGSGILHLAAEYAAKRKSGKTVVISDENVWRLHGQTLEAELFKAEISYSAIVVAAGEESKSFATLEHVCSELLKAEIGRDGLIMAFGGGVIGDLAGFAASIWMRGCDYIQIPTTLLSQIDSSVGGKTAVNLAGGKNMVGTFYQPRLVVADVGLLETLPEREWRCGLSEMIKYAALFSAKLFEKLNNPLDKTELPELVKICCEMKRDLVQTDEKDTGKRMLLNFGHTFGHAIENLGGFSRYNHGEAVGIGMVLATAFGEYAGYTAPGCSGKIANALKLHGLATTCLYNATEMLDAMMHDKKSRKGGLDLILIKDIALAGTEWYSIEKLQKMMPEVIV